jgi:transcriptional regulator with GAF, ATPase, and Fis domain
MNAERAAIPAALSVMSEGSVMGVSAFPGRDNRLPSVERLAQELCARLSEIPSESLDDRLREVLLRLVDEFALDGALLVLPAGQRIRATGVGNALTSGRVISEFLARPRVQGVTSQSEILLVSGPPHSTTSALASDDHLHLWALGIRTLVVVPLWRQRFEGGAIALYSQRSNSQLDVLSLRPLTTVAEAIRTALDQSQAALPAPVPNFPEPDASRRTTTATDAGMERQNVASPEETLVGESAAWRYVVFRLEQVAATHATVLLLGETGTGKELVARAIHRRSARAAGKFVALNCAALPATLVESELFGRERGAFTGAHSSQAGRFELAHRGTLFLDEVGDLPIELQPKLLRVLQEGQLERLGSTRTVDVDVRVIAATNRDLTEEVRQNRFRDDLYYRLNVFPITLPSLRERREDIPLLAQHLANRFARAMPKPVKPIPDSVSRALQQYDWPGNIRELENVIQRAIILSPDGVISINDISLSSAKPATAATGTTLEEVERNHIQRMLSTTLWRIEGRRGAAELLGLKPSTLRSRLRKLGIRRGM